MSAYRTDILAQPAALQDTLDLLNSTSFPKEIQHDLQAGRWRKIVLTGMGSSYFVFLPLYHRLISAGLPTWLVETSELLYWPAFLTPDTLVITASQSGSSVETVRLLEKFGSQCSMIGVTNTVDSPLARRSTFAILTRAGEEATVSCKTYLATLAAQSWLGDQLIEGQHEFNGMASTPQIVQAYLDELPEHIAALKLALDGVCQVYLVGRGVSIAAAGTGGLILKESVHIPAEGMSSAAFRHGPFEMVGPETFVLVFAGFGETIHLNRRLYSDVIAAGGRAALVLPGGQPPVFALPSCPDPVLPALPVLEILPVQMMTLALAELRNLQAGSFSLGTKVTTIE
ncbi:MAG: SIS domain-containing protein [Anaerolineaceae bacterium]|jgi:glucosamine--fructose-6-phosphate aminotransferase (isomerizing)